MSILVTGGAGFIGSYVVRALVRRGESVVVLDANLETTPLRRLLEPADLEQVVQLRVDIADPLVVFRAVQEHHVRRIIHLATISIAGENDPWNSVRVNVQGTLAAFEAARLFDVGRVVWASSAQVYGRHTPYSKEFGGPLMDEGPHRPWTVYSASKSLCEYMGKHYHRKFGLDLRGLRPVGTFGPGRQGGLTAYVTAMVKAAALGEPYTVPNGDQAMPMAYVEDSARAFELALYYEGSEMTGRTLNIGGFSTTNREMAEIVRRVIPDAQITVLPGDGGEPVTLPFDNSTFCRLTGFRLEVSLEEGIRRSLAAFQEQTARDLARV
jgi:nucleoside-diphosphate-sugar epimerase